MASSPPSPRIVLGRRTLLGLGSLGLVALIWAGATTWYILARDEVAQLIFARQAEIEASYEDRVAALRTRLEREVTQGLVERTGFEAKARQIQARQSEIEARQAWLHGIAAGSGPVATGSLPPRTAPEPPPAAELPASTKPVPLDGPFGLRLREGAATPRPGSPAGERLSAIEQSLESVAIDELRSFDALRRLTRGQVASMRGALDATGLDLDRFARPRSRKAPSAVGGPFVPVASGPVAGALGTLSAEIAASVIELDGLRDVARGLPLGRPLQGHAEQTSPFGVRVDPFTRGTALHTGVDLRAEAGTPVLATGAGRVIEAAPAGGYGNMVEIDHGGGVTTRYGHLSAFAVGIGDIVAAGQTIGRAGSTGRSTGSHVHYETRINGEPVNPTRFLDAGRLLQARG